MRPSLRTALSTALIVALLGSASYAAVVTVDVVSKLAKSDVTTLNPAEVQVQHEQVGVLIKNTTMEQQSFALRMTGLAEQSYDVYSNGSFLGTKTAEELASGIDLKAEGRIVPAAMTRCLQSVKDPLRTALRLLQKKEDPEAKRICGTLGQAVACVTMSLERDQNWRSVVVIVSPTGKALYRLSSVDRRSEEDTVSLAARACWLLQQARARMSKVIKNTQLRDQAVLALTPIAFSTDYYMKNAKPHVEVVVVNNCDLRAYGSISMSLPKGWRCSAKSLGTVSVEPGRTLKLAFDLIAPAKTAAPPDMLPIAANLTCVQNNLSANLKLKVTTPRR